MKILYICNHLKKIDGWGVINYYTATECSELNKTFVFTKNNDDIDTIPGVAKFCILYDIDIPSLLNKIIIFTKNAFGFIYLLRKIKPDVVHFLCEPYFPYLFLVNNRKTSICFSLVGTYSLKLTVGVNKLFTEYLIRKRVHHFIAISDYTLNVFLKSFCNKDQRELSIKCSVLKLGVDYNSLSSSHFLDHEKELSFCTVGAVKERKGAIFSIKAVALLRDKYPNIKLYIIGRTDNDYARTCIDYVKSNGLESNVFFLGHKNWETLSKIYEKCLANILHSINAIDGAFEGFGLIHLEANSCGIPSIGTFKCGNESAIVENVNGFLTEQKDYKKLSTIMDSLIQMYLYRQDCYNLLCESSKNYAHSNDWKFYMDKLNKLYREIK